MPEALFNLAGNNGTTSLSLYSTLTSEFYLSSSSGIFSQFVSAANSKGTSSSSSSSNTTTVGGAKLILSVTNAVLPVS